MKKSQVKSGKAFEYICLQVIKTKSKSLGITVNILADNSYIEGEISYNSLNSDDKNNYKLGASAALDFIFSCEPFLKDGVLATNLDLSMQADNQGQKGDVRDILMLRWVSSTNKKQWNCGISCKHNHSAVKHQRVGLTNANWVKNWCPSFECSERYLSSISSISEKVEHNKNSKKWSEIFTNISQNLYAPVVKAVRDEIELYKDDKDFVLELFSFLLGTIDFYKIMTKDDEKVTIISVFNFNGSLNQKTSNSSPDRKIRRTPLPSKILSLWNNESYLTIFFDEGWAVKMRIHTASSKIETSLKFDSQLEGVPYTLLNLTFPW